MRRCIPSTLSTRRFTPRILLFSVCDSLKWCVMREQLERAENCWVEEKRFRGKMVDLCRDLEVCHGKGIWFIFCYSEGLFSRLGDINIRAEWKVSKNSMSGLERKWVSFLLNCFSTHCLSPETASPIKAELRESAIGTPRCPLASVSASHTQGDCGEVGALGLSPPIS